MQQILTMHDWTIVLDPSGGCEFFAYYSFDTQGLIVVDHDDDLVMMADLAEDGGIGVRRVAFDKIVDIRDRSITVRCNPSFHGEPA